jgi:hypothetical protein
MEQIGRVSGLLVGPRMEYGMVRCYVPFIICIALFCMESAWSVTALSRFWLV